MVVALSVALTEWAGTATVLSADVEVSANVSADAEITLPQIAKIERQYQKIVGLFALISVFGVSYGIGQRRLRQNAIAELHPYQKQYELEHDPRRSSSTLDKVGNTNPGDR